MFVHLSSVFVTRLMRTQASSAAARRNVGGVTHWAFRMAEIMVPALGFGARAPPGRDLDDGLCDGHEQETSLRELIQKKIDMKSTWVPSSLERYKKFRAYLVSSGFKALSKNSVREILVVIYSTQIPFVI